MGCPKPPDKRQASVHKPASAGRQRGPCLYMAAIVMTLSLATDHMRIFPRALSVAAWIALGSVLLGCSDAPKQAAAPPPPKVTVAKPVKRTIVDQDEYVGRFVAVDSVEV